MNETPVAVPSTSHVPRADLTTSMALLTKMQRAHQAVEDLAEEGHRIATEHDHALSHCRAELQCIDVACKTAIGDSAGSTYDAVVRVLDKLAEAQAVIAHIEQERARAEQAEDQVRQSLKVAVEENVRLRSEVATIRDALADPVAVHVNMLRGDIAKPDVRALLHLHGQEALERWDSVEALQAEAVRMRNNFDGEVAREVAKAEELWRAVSTAPTPADETPEEPAGWWQKSLGTAGL